MAIKYCKIIFFITIWYSHDCEYIKVFALLLQGGWKREHQQDVFAQPGNGFRSHFASAFWKRQQNLKQLTADLHEWQLVSRGHGSGKTPVRMVRQGYRDNLWVSDRLVCISIGPGPSLLPSAGEHSNTWQQTSKPFILYWSITGTSCTYR